MYYRKIALCINASDDRQISDYGFVIGVEDPILESIWQDGISFQEPISRFSIILCNGFGSCARSLGIHEEEVNPRLSRCL